jgi:hypothetical protein
VSPAKTETLTAKPDPEPKSTPAPFIVRDEPAPKTPENAERRQPTAVPPFRPTSRQTIREQARPEDVASGLSARRGWLYAVAAFVAIFAILWFVHSRGSQNPGPTRSTDTAAAKKPAAAWPTNTLTPDAKAPTAGPATPAAEPPQPAAKLSQPVTKANRSAPPQTGARTIWRVVLYTYSHESDAQKRASELAAKKPDLHAEVFSSTASGPYLVVAGDGTTREEAARTRVRAIREGMPRDSYIQNYSH